MRTRGPFDAGSTCSMTLFVVSAITITHKKNWRALTYLVYMDVVKVVFVIDGFE